MTQWKLTCACGWETSGTEQQIVSAAREHGVQVHNMDITDEQAMAMASPIDDTTAS
jgi:predicted small metal-binding protein